MTRERERKKGQRSGKQGQLGAVDWEPETQQKRKSRIAQKNIEKAEWRPQIQVKKTVTNIKFYSSFHLSFLITKVNFTPHQLLKIKKN